MSDECDWCSKHPIYVAYLWIGEQQREFLACPDHHALLEAKAEECDGEIERL